MLTDVNMLLLRGISSEIPHFASSMLAFAYRQGNLGCHNKTWIHSLLLSLPLEWLILEYFRPALLPPKTLAG